MGNSFNVGVGLGGLSQGRGAVKEEVGCAEDTLSLSQPCLRISLFDITICTLGSPQAS